MSYAETWATALARAGKLDPAAIAPAIGAQADVGLRAARYDSDGGGRTSNVECRDETCEDGPDLHSHPITSDPTGNAATRGRRSDSGAADRARLDEAERDFVLAAQRVLCFVCGHAPLTWAGVIRTNARLMPGTIQAGLDVDDTHALPHAIDRVERAVNTVAAIAAAYLPRTPSQDEQHWTAGLGPNDVCAWHLEIHERYRRPRLPGKNICQGCADLAILLGQRPPQWLIEAEVDLRESRPLAWRAALSRCMDELGILRNRSA